MNTETVQVSLSDDEINKLYTTGVIENKDPESIKKAIHQLIEDVPMPLSMKNIVVLGFDCEKSVAAYTERYDLNTIKNADVFVRNGEMFIKGIGENLLKEERNLWTSTLNDRIQATFLNRFTASRITIEKDDDNFTINHGPSANDYGSFETFEEARGFIEEQEPEAVEINVKESCYKTIERDFEGLEKWGEEQVKKLTCGKMNSKLSPRGCDDYISASTIIEAFNEYQELPASEKENYWKEGFESYLYGNIDDYFDNDRYYEEESCLIKEIEENLSREGSKQMKAAYEDLKNDGYFDGEILEKFGYRGTYIDVPAFLSDNYHINLMFATDSERNLDMGAIDCFYDTDIFNIGKELLTNKQEFAKYADNALSYLVQQQGYDIHEVIDAIHSGDENKPSFIKSVSRELDNQTYSMCELTALVTANGKDLVNLLSNIASGKKYIELPENTVIGLFNEWDGAGSVLEIELDKPAVIPCSMVRNVQMEGARKENDGYTVDSVYGLVGTVWNNNAKIVDEAPKLKETNLEVAQQKLKSYADKEKNKIEHEGR